MGDMLFFLTWLILTVEVKVFSEVMKVLLSFCREILPYNKHSVIFVDSLKYRSTRLERLFMSLLLVSHDFMLIHYLFKEAFDGKGRNFFPQKMLILLTLYKHIRPMYVIWVKHLPSLRFSPLSLTWI